MIVALEERRQPHDDRECAALYPQSKQRAQDRRLQVTRCEDDQRIDTFATGVLFLLGFQEDFRFLHAAQCPENPDGRKCADPEHPAPGLGRFDRGEEHRRQDGRKSVSECIGALDATDGLAAIGRANDFTHENCACGPFATEAEAGENAGNQKVLIGIGKAACDGKYGEPCDGDLHDLHATDAITKNAGDPTTD
ncbi:hypothetical protein D3C73_423430 [compost metagenome]